MTYLSEEQFEDILAGRQKPPDDLNGGSQAELAAAKAVQSRLRRAAESIETPTGLNDRIRLQLSQATITQPAESKAIESPRGLAVHQRPTHPVRKLRFLGRIPLAAAAMLVIGMGVWMFATSQSVHAQADVAAIHAANLAHQNNFLPGKTIEALNTRLEKELGKKGTPFPQLSGDCKYMGSTLAKFRGQSVGCAVVQFGGKPVSIIRVDNVTTKELNFRHSYTRDGRDFCRCSYKNCKMMAVQVGKSVFIATGEVDKNQLRKLLETLVAAHKSHA